MAVAVSAHDILRVYDCTFPGCINDAERGSDRCRRHEGVEAPVGVNLLEALEGVAGEAVEPPAPLGSGACKVDGCNLPRKATRGRYAGLCEEHTEERRASAPVKESRPEPSPPASASEGFEARAQRLVEAGRSLDEARLALDEAGRIADEARLVADAAHRVHSDAVSEWDAARAALSEGH